MPDRTLIASATNIMASGFLVVPTDRVSRAAEPVNGVFAVARALHRVLAFRRPARAVAVIDAAAPLAAWPELLKPQVAMLPELLRALGMRVVTVDGELDVVASYARAAVEAGDDVIIAGVDKRFSQLVTDRVWWYDANKDARYTPEVVYKRFGVGPEKVREWLALVGDLDQLPGVKGIGAKGATGLLEQFDTVADALKALDAGTLEGRLAKVLDKARAEIPAELVRATLDQLRALPLPLSELTYAPPPAAPLNALYDRLGFVELLVSDESSLAVEVCAQEADLTAALAAMAGTVTLHALLEDPDPVQQKLVGIALAGADEQVFYVSATGAAWPALAAWLASDAPKQGHDLVGSGTHTTLRQMGIVLGGVVGDSACASHLTQPSNWAPHDLGVIAKPVLGRALPDDDSVRGVGMKRKDWAQLAIDKQASIAGQRADASAAIWRALSPALDPALLGEYLALSQILVRMELTGLIVEPAALDRAEVAFAEIETELTAQIEVHAGHSFNINSSKQLGEVLFEQLKLPVAGHTKTGWSTSIESLEKIDNAHPIVPLVIRWRLLRRMRDNWIVALRKTVDTDGRVHSRFHPARSFNGHIINTNPDLGRVPGRTPEMAMIRRAFVAPPGKLLMSVDYSQLGLYVIAHLTKDPNLVGPLSQRADMHRLTASAVLEIPAADVTTEQRQLGKVINFATFAGQGASALALQLGVTAAEAKEYLARFDRHYALVRAFQDDQLRFAKERGYIVTLAGRKWPIGGLESLDSHDRSYAERLARRATHEGSVSDVSRRAVLDSDRALRAAGLQAQPLISILDEVLFEVPETELKDAARVCADAMKHAFELEVPLVVGVEAGPNWADIERIEY
ncbi:MAG TPA: DNA polymerase [Kofleriaceae bacterium]|jgi:DNA polymerase-1